MGDASNQMKIDNSGILSMADITKMLSTIFPQKTSEVTSSAPSEAALANSNAVLGAVTPGITDPADALVQNILDRSAQAFLGTRTEEHMAGMYDTSTVKQLSDEARARATGEAAKGVKDYQANSARTAAEITNAQLQASKVTNKAGTVAPLLSGSNLGTLIAAGGLISKMTGAKATDIFKNKAGAPVEERVASRARGDDYQTAHDVTEANMEGSGENVASSLGMETPASGGATNAEAGNSFLQNSFAARDTGTAGLTAADGVIEDTGMLETADTLAAAEAGGEAGAGLAGASAEGAADFFGGGVVDAAAEFAAEDFGWEQVAETVGKALLAVVCSELHAQGIMSDALYNADQKFSRAYISVEVITGYHVWAKPYARLMKKSKLATNFAKPFAFAWINQVGYDHSPDKHLYKNSTLGTLIRVFGESFCFVLGSFILWKNNLGVKHGCNN